MNKKKFKVISSKIVCYICVILALCLIICSFLTSCNKQIIDINYTFNYGIIELPGGETVEGKVQSWRDYEDGDQIQVKINDVVYLVHSSDCALMHK